MDKPETKESEVSEQSTLINRSRESKYDHYAHLVSLKKLSPICVNEEFEFGFGSLYSILSSIRVIILLIFVTQFGIRFDKLFQKKYMKHHWKYYLLLVTPSLILIIIIPIQFNNPLPFSVALILYICGYSSFYIFATIYFYFNINDIMINKMGKVFTIKFFQLYFIFGFQFHLLCMTIFFNSTRNALIFDEYNISSTVSFSVGFILILIGAFFSTSAVYAIGFNTYYWFDMVLKIPNSYFTADSVYKYVSNPIYLFGMINVYGFAIMKRSAIGLIVAILNHVGIYTVYFLNEKPFIKQMYST